jgi:hypothetical protein
MIRRVLTVCVAAALPALSAGCRSDCGGGWFSSSSRGSAPCQLTGRSPDMMLDSTGMPIGGAPGTFVPGNSVPLMPSSPPGTPLPFPQPNDLIPRQGVPGIPPAVPSPAPGDGGAAILPAPKFGVPVNSNK